MVKIDLKETVTLIKTDVDEWNRQTITDEEDVKSLFISNTGYSHSANQNAIDSTAAVYLDSTNEFVKNNFNRLEEMLVVAQPYGDEYPESWYKITNVDVGQDKLLGNKIDNILVNLKKTTEISRVS